jgi:hypothetical protein
MPAVIRHVDVPTSGPATAGLGPLLNTGLGGALESQPYAVNCGWDEHVVSVETIKDTAGYGTVRIWIARNG